MSVLFGRPLFVFNLQVLLLVFLLPILDCSLAGLQFSSLVVQHFFSVRQLVLKSGDRGLGLGFDVNLNLVKLGLEFLVLAVEVGRSCSLFSCRRRIFSPFSMFSLCSPFTSSSS